MKRIISMALTLAILLSMIPLEALAAAHSRSGQIHELQTAADVHETADIPVEFIVGEQPEPVPPRESFEAAQETAADSLAVSVTSAEGFTYTVLDDTNCEITGYTGTDTELVIPAQLDGYTVQRIGRRAFFDNTVLTSVVLPEGLTEIYSQAFGNCTGLTGIEFPDSVTTMSAGAFYCCSNLAEISYPIGWVTTLSSNDGLSSDYADSSYGTPFSGCTALKTIEVPEGVTAIPAHAFKGCAGLEQIILPESLTEIRMYAFQNCIGLKELILPDSVTTIANCAFANCAGLTRVELGESLNSMGHHAFQNCAGLTGITIPATLTRLDTGVFDGCTGLTSVTLPEGLTTIYSRAFGNCTGLTGIEFPDSVTTMSAGAFYCCSNLAEINYPIGWVTTLSSNNGLSSDYADSSYGTPFSGCAALKTIEVPEGITTIPAHAFKGCSGLEQIILPESLTEIRMYAFQNCTGLKEIILPAGVTTIGDRAFKGCTGLKRVELNRGLTATGYYVFDNCTGLTQVTLPDTLTELDTGFFFGCTGLTSVTLPEGLTSIGDNAFRGTALKHITFPDTLRSIGSLAFDSCTGLRSISLNSRLSSLGSSVFANCTGLESAYMTCALTGIPWSAFSGCSNLRDVLLPPNLQTIGNYAFQNCAVLTQLRVPISVTAISGNDSFSGVPDLVFYCDLNSYAATYAIDHDIPIVDTGTDNSAAHLPLDRDNSYYKVNSDGISASGYLSMVAKYTLRESTDVSPRELTFSIPDSVSLVESSLTVDGKLCTSYAYGGGVLTIPVTAHSAVVRFLLKPLSYDRVELYSSLSFSDRTSQIVGVVYTELPILSVAVPEETSETSVKVSGVTIPESFVTLYVNDVERVTVQANKIGDFHGEVSLNAPGNGQKFTIKAVNRDHGSTAEAITTYWDTTPVLTRFVMTYGANTIDMMEAAKGSARVIWRNGSDYHFTIGFRNADCIEAVFVVGKRNNIKKCIPAVWDETLQLYVAEGFFDSDKSYLPHTVSVAYIHENGEISFSDSFDYTSEEARDSIPAQLQDAEVTVFENTENRTDVLIEQDASGEGSLHIVTEVQQIPAGFTAAQAEAQGYSGVTDSQGKTAYVQICEENGQQSVKVIDFDLGQIITTVAEVVSAYVDESGVKGYELVGTLGDCLDLLNMAEYGFNGMSDLHTYANMKQQIFDSSLTEADQQLAIDYLNDTVMFSTLSSVARVQLVALGSLAIPMVGAALGPLGIAAMMVCLKAADASLDALQQIAMLQMEDYMQELLSAGFAWMIDPSGYIYDAETGERIQGATVTVYWIPYDGTDETYWDAPPDEDVYGEAWLASEYSQQNPLITDEEGRYAWDVPEGWWRVRCEHADYATVWSSWLPVPPPQLDVNLAMTPIRSSLPGDFNGDGQVNDADVEYLLWHTLFADLYPISGNADFNGDGSVNDADVEYLLWHTLFPGLYPL